MPDETDPYEAGGWSPKGPLAPPKRQMTLCSCRFCGKAFSASAGLSQHERSFHVNALRQEKAKDQDDATQPVGQHPRKRAEQAAAQHLPDDYLLKQTAQARYDAHTAQKATPGGFKTAWSSSSRTWMELAAEVDRRGLRQPEATDFRSP